jgi:hypothetical protein
MKTIEIINILTGLFLIGSGFLVKRFPDLIAGYNTMSDERKKNVDIHGLSSLMRNGLIIIGLTIILGYYFFNWIGFANVAGSIIMYSTLGGTMILLILAQKFDHNRKFDFWRAKSRGLFLAVGVLGLVIIISIGFIFYGTRPQRVVAHGDEIKITGLYGLELNITDIEKIELKKQIPKIELRTNGFSFGSAKKGNFKLTEFGKCKLFLQSEHPPFILLMDKNGERLIINYKNETETEQKFSELITLLKK